MHFPGFDTGSYPGDATMTTWAAQSPYDWVGFYLTAPCHTAARFTPWAGHYQFLHDLGWGFAILYVGLQQHGCGNAHLSRDRGTQDGNDAVSLCQTEGFPRNAILYLDVEHFDGAISATMKAYYQGWIGAVLDSRMFQPGTYCAARNFNDVFRTAQQEYANHGFPGGGPTIWIVKRQVGFDPTADEPPGCGIPAADLWQGMTDITETHGGVSLLIDQDTAHSKDPSNARRDIAVPSANSPDTEIDIIDPSVDGSPEE